MNTQYLEYIKTVEKIKFIMGDESIALIPNLHDQFSELYNQYLSTIEGIKDIPLNPEDMLFKIQRIILFHHSKGTSIAKVQKEILNFIVSVEKEFKPSITNISGTNECSCSPRDLFQQGCLCGAFKRK